MKFIDLVLYIVYAGTYSIIIPVGIGSFFVKRMNKTISVFYLGLVAVLILDVIILFIDARLRNGFLYLFTIIDLSVLTWVFTSLMHGNRAKRIAQLMAVLMVILVMMDGLLYSGLEVNGLSNSIARLFIALLAIYYLSKMMTTDVERDLTQAPMLWISIGVIVYNLVGFFDVFAGPIMNYSQNMYLQYYMLWSLCTLAMYLLFAKAFRVIWKSDEI